MGMGITIKRNKYITVIVLVSMLLTTLFNSPYSMVTADNPCINWDGNIENNTIFVNNSMAYLSATPHTLTSKGWVEFELESKKFSGNIDVGFGFNTTTAKPKKLEIWKNGNWSPFGFDCNIVDYSTCFFDNTDTWYLYTDIPIQKDVRYKIRGYIDIPFGGLNGSSGKYWLIIKPHDKTIAQSIFDGYLLYLDPWWNENWEFYRTITIESDYIDSELTNFPILVNISDEIGDKCKGNGQDLRFLLPDNSTVLNHEIDTWVDNGERFVWVNVTTISSDVDTVILMYYGNDGASDGQNPADVWDSDFLAVYHMVHTQIPAHFVVWDSIEDFIVERHAFKAGEQNPSATEDGKIGEAQDFESDDTQDRLFDEKVGSILDVTVECWYKPESIGGLYMLVENTYYAAAGRKGFTFMVHSPDNKMQWVVQTPSGSMFTLFSTTELTVGSFWYVAGVLSDENYGRVFVNGVQDGEDNTITGTMTNDADAELRVGADRLTTGGAYRYWVDGVIDEVRVSKVARSNTWINVSFHTQNQSIDFLVFGSEQTYLNVPPIQSGEIPVNASINMSIIPSLYVLCTDADNDNLNATWWSNSSGEWIQFASNWTGFASSTNITQINTNFTGYNTTYYWSVNLTDGEYWVNETYHFTTELAIDYETWDYSQPLSWLIRNETGVTILKLSMSGNMAIAGTLYEQDIKEVKKHVQHIESFLENNYNYTSLEWI